MFMSTKKAYEAKTEKWLSLSISINTMVKN